MSITYFVVCCTKSSKHARIFAVECLDREVRVGGGGVNSASGVVEVCLSDEWRSVTSQSWGDEEATVVCRQLRYDGGMCTVEPENDGQIGTDYSVVYRERVTVSSVFYRKVTFWCSESCPLFGMLY